MGNAVRWLVAISLLVPWSYSFSQTDAGRLLQQQPSPPGPASVVPAPATPAAQPADVDNSPQIEIKGFRIQGALLITEKDLQRQLQPLIGRRITLRQLQGAAAGLGLYYLSKGYIARVVVPPQNVNDGIYSLQIIEGKRGAVEVINSDKKLDTARVQGFLDSRLKAVDHLDFGALGESLAILNEQPGVKASADLKQGKQESEIDIMITADSTPRLQFTTSLNNHGSRATGEYQLSGGLTVNNLSGNFDALSVLTNVSDGTTFARLDYGLAVGNRGLRLGARVSSLRYKLTQSSFAALQGNGNAQTLGLIASYPLARRPEFNLSLTGNYDSKRLVDRTVAGETSNRQVDVIALGLTGFVVQDVLATSFSIAINAGGSDQRNVGALAADKTGRNVQGSFTKLSYNVTQVLSLAKNFSFNPSLRGQLASKNLDSSERISLGGPGAIRAYPTGEATGDEAWLLNLNLSYAYNSSLAASLFVDAGGVERNRVFTPALIDGLPNSYSLAGWGVGLDWRISPNVILTTTIAAPLGSNPGRNANNQNVDGSAQNAVRGFVSLNAQF